ncbi:helix-turn-helix domain-containing protein [Pseudomonas sp. GD04087]|uniref:helix-turn-helix domain-containing protein n=1 Tax=unclassified Pseudomonas TaxID=196821 RepID=UPI0024498625|nr:MULTISPECIES: helix-turn-helix domain-containing protein [unclassified Pseudomonas]MDH0293588.1 helix-turn-helix domain-containing protein [Pseudomonas sp. GD04087]MDH1048945.1 helix-turn-helix domain-containing protein [Pseudomonas sp. GD03903]MDH2003778.1 helix-turn-helix domain-containing protein [Pseudomonas sp. GD03691]
MDSLITAAARALAAGDPLGALNRVALRADPPALALRGIAMAQLGDFPRARTLLRQAARAFGAHEPMERARCQVAEAEVALASRELNWPSEPLEQAAQALLDHGDRLNAAHARYLLIRRGLLIGKLDDADAALSTLEPDALPPSLRTVHWLIASGIAVRRLQAGKARAALQRASEAAAASGIAALRAEVEQATRTLDAPAARQIARPAARLLSLDEVESLLRSDALVVDACRNRVGSLSLGSRPVIFALARALAEAWPGDASRTELIARVFRIRQPDETHRARLRVEMGRLRRLLQPLAGIESTPRGYRLVAANPVVLAPPLEDANAEVLALLSDGQAWSSSALALALDTSQRSVQRALEALSEAGRVQVLGQGRARRWTLPPVAGFATTLLLPAPFGA